MQAQSIPASGATLSELLAALSGPTHRAALRPGPGFGLEFTTGEAQLEPAGPGRYRATSTFLEAQVALEVFPEHGVAVQQVTLTNIGAAPTPPLRALHAVALPLEVRTQNKPFAARVGGGLTDGFYPPRAYQVERVTFGKARDWDPEKASFTRWWIGKGIYRLANDEAGWSANPMLPLIVAGWEAEEGEAGLWASLEWSARWELAFGTQKPDWLFALWGGPRVKGLVLAPGETLALPKVHVGVFVGHSAHQADAFNSVRRYVRDAIAPDVEGQRPHALVAYHHWFGIEENLSETLLMKQADRAAELGAEYFEVDAAWFAGGVSNFADGVGNWERVDAAKFPIGLEPLADYVRAKGMRFGLWFEPERARKGSDWLTQHPAWYWDVGNPVNFMLDLTRTEVQDALIKMLSQWIARLDIRWLRWDHNHPLGQSWDKVDPTGKVQFAYVAGVYRVRRELIGRFPNLLIENCAGGGNRIDFGILRSSASQVISDHPEDPHVCRIMQTGGARALPANYTNSSFYVGPADPERAIGPLELMSRMAGSISLSGYIANWSEQQAAQVKHYLDGYRTFRHLLIQDFYPLAPYPRDETGWDVVEFVDPATGEAVVLAYRVRGDTQRQQVRPVKLLAERRYRAIDPVGGRKLRSETGAALMAKGLRVSLEPDSAAIIHLRPETE